MNRKVQGVRNFVDDHMIERLKDRELAVDYLNAAMEDGDPDVLLVALRDVVKAHGGFTEVAERGGFNRESLQRMLSRRGNPAYRNLAGILSTLGMKLAVQPRPQDR
jgi:probable addiction module antidote protein